MAYVHLFLQTTSRREHLYGIVCAMVVLVLTLACGSSESGNEPLKRQANIPTPDRSQVLIIEDQSSAGPADVDAISAYQQDYVHMRTADWFSTLAEMDHHIGATPIKH